MNLYVLFCFYWSIERFWGVRKEKERDTKESGRGREKKGRGKDSRKKYEELKCRLGFFLVWKGQGWMGAWEGEMEDELMEEERYNNVLDEGREIRRWRNTNEGGWGKRREDVVEEVVKKGEMERRHIWSALWYRLTLLTIILKLLLGTLKMMKGFFSRIDSVIVRISG